MPNIRVVNPTDGTVYEFQAASTTERYRFDEMDVASVTLDRQTANRIPFKPDLHEVYVEDPNNRRDLFGGVLRDVVRGGGEPELVVDSFERYAMDAEPSPTTLVYENVEDADVVRDVVDDVDELYAGDIRGAGVVTLVFPYTSPARRARTAMEAAGAEIKYNSDRTIDYWHIGENKSESQTGKVLSPSNQNIDEKFDPEWDAGDKRVTHLVMLGAGEGDAQKSAHIVPESDPYDYEGDDDYTVVRRYAANDWDEGQRRAWESRINKDMTDEETLADQGEALISEFNAEYLDVKTIVVDEYVELGDKWTLRNDAEGIYHDLRAAEVRRVVNKDGFRSHVTFSNRRLTRQSETDKVIQDVDRYNKGFEGTAVTMNTGGGRQPVNSRIKYQFDVYYPAEVEYEHRVKLQVNGLPYRAYSSGAAGGGDHTHTISLRGETNSDMSPPKVLGTDTADGSFSSSTSWKLVRSANVPDETAYTIFHLSSRLNSLQTTGSLTNQWRIYNATTGDHYPTPEGVVHYVQQSSDEGEGAFSVAITVPGDVAGDSLEIQQKSSNSGDSYNYAFNGVGLGTHSHSYGQTETSDASGEHTHEPDPGVQEFRTHPTSCDVIVNGSSMGQSLGNGGRFRETVDLRGELISGSWNTIEISSQTLGHIQASLDVDVYRQILGRG